MKQKIRRASIAFVGSTCAIFLLQYLSAVTHKLWLIGPFGATCVLLFLAEKVPFSRPKNIFGGYLISAAVAFSIRAYLPVTMLTIALSVGLAIALMALSNCVHPPAGAVPLLVMTSAVTWQALGFALILGTILLLLASIICHTVIPAMVTHLKRTKKHP